MEGLGKIRNIKEVFDVTVPQATGRMSGYKITTTQHVILILIDNFQQCCENWGYVVSDDNLPYFIGAELYDVTVADDVVDKMESALENEGVSDADEETQVQFVNAVTDKGVLQFALYNSHNGYYGHEVLLLEDGKVKHRDKL